FLKQIRRERSPTEAQASQLIAEMTNAERAEFMTLVELARGHLRVGDKREHTARAVDQDWSPEHVYLVGKFGNG
ncbi:hypothetical protein, partial [Klebsiella pneumoniae]|uniref:hypothetical protein n=1 Tax=Klebsiella pneumoniae TaxID=573 RepID=UPI0021589EEF